MIKILKIEFKNFRQYKHIAIDFSKECKNNLHILRAKNGTGKTTFLNAVLWCLYNDEKYLSDADRALPIINESLVQSSQAGAKEEVNVRITIQDEDRTIVFSRTLGFTITEDPLRHTKSAKPGSSSFKVTVTYRDPKKNSDTYDDEEKTSGWVKRYFDSEIFDYYFFDGENLENYFNADSNKRDEIRKSIYNIAQVTLLETASKHAATLATEKARKVNTMTGTDTSIYQELEDAKKDLEKLIRDNKKYEEEIVKYNQRITIIDKTLDEVKPLQLKLKERDRLESQLRILENQRKAYLLRRNSFIVDYTIYLNYYPLVKSTLDMILEKEKNGSLPPDIDKKLLKRILNDHITTCPVCKNTIDQKAILAIQQLIDTLDVDSATSNKLMEIKGSLEKALNQAKRYPEAKRRLLDDGRALDEGIRDIERQLNDISSFLSNMGTIDEIDIPALESERRRKQDAIISNHRSIASNNVQIENKRDSIRDLEKQTSQFEENNRNKNILLEQVSVLRKLSATFDEVKANIAEEIKQEIEDITWDFFDSMVWKIHTFDHLEINENYLLSLYNKYGTEITGSASATEKMALAYAFTFAIHEASGKNCPLIIDSPLGRVSDDNRANMARELLKVSKSKQIIMLFTPDEYSDEVRKLYDVEAGSVRDIRLSDDENEIMTVGD